MIDELLARAARANHGIVGRAPLLALGLTEKQIDHRARQGILIPVHAGVYRHAACAPTEHSRLVAALVAADDLALVSHRSAAWLHQLRDVPRWRPELTVVGTRLPRLHRVDVHRSDTLHADDVASVDGIPVTSVARCILDLGAVVREEVVVQAAQDAVIRGAVTPEQLVDVLTRLGGRGRRGTATLRAVIDGLPPEALASQLELRLLRLIELAIPEPPELQHKLVLPDGSVIYLDFAWPRRRLAVEADGRRWHATKADFERGLRRSRGITALGWDHYHYGWTDVTAHPEQVTAELRSIFVASTPSEGGDATKNGGGQTVWKAPSVERMSQRRRSTAGLSSSLLT